MLLRNVVGLSQNFWLLSTWLPAVRHSQTLRPARLICFGLIWMCRHVEKFSAAGNGWYTLFRNRRIRNALWDLKQCHPIVTTLMVSCIDLGSESVCNVANKSHSCQFCVFWNNGRWERAGGDNVELRREFHFDKYVFRGLSDEQPQENVRIKAKGKRTCWSSSYTNSIILSLTWPGLPNVYLKDMKCRVRMQTRHLNKLNDAWIRFGRAPLLKMLTGGHKIFDRIQTHNGSFKIFLRNKVITSVSMKSKYSAVLMSAGKEMVSSGLGIVWVYPVPSQSFKLVSPRGGMDDYVWGGRPMVLDGYGFGTRPVWPSLALARRFKRSPEQNLNVGVRGCGC